VNNDGRILLAALNLYVRIKVRLAPFDTNSVTDSNQSIDRSIFASIQMLPDSVVKSVSRARPKQSMCQKKQLIYRSV
jgi:hypothetical protein